MGLIFLRRLGLESESKSLKFYRIRLISESETQVRLEFFKMKMTHGIKLRKKNYFFLVLEILSLG